MFLKSPPSLILASTSIYRRELLARLKIPFECQASGVDESPHFGETALALVARLARAKARAVAVGRPEAWEWAVQMVRKGGTVNFFGGCASGTKVQLDTNRLHYSEITLKATFHHTPETVRRAFGLIAEKKVRGTDYITGEAPLSRLHDVLRHMLNRNGDIKTAIIPGH